MSDILKPRYVASRTYDNETIIYNLKDTKIFIINEIASQIWNFIDEVSTISDLTSKLQSLYNTDKNEIKNDLTDFLNSLEKNGLVIISNKGGQQTSKSFSQKSKTMDLEQKISIKMSRNLQLYSVMFELTYLCNENCIHCYAKNTEYKDRKELSFEEIRLLLDELHKLNVLKVTFSGGEPFIRKEFLEIFEYARKKGFVVDIFSNGLLADDYIIDKIARLYPRSFQSSIYSANPEIHDSITRVKGSFFKTIETLKKFKQKGVPINIKTILMKQSIKDYEKIKELANNLGATYQIDISLTAKNNGDRSTLKYRVTDEKDIEKILLDKDIDLYVSDDFIKEGIIGEHRNDDGFICGAGTNGLSINPYGEVYPCTALKFKIGDVRKQSISDIWYNSKELKYFRNLKWKDLKDCVDCEYKNYCIFCPGASLSETGSMLKKYEGACIIAKIRKRIVERQYDNI